METAINIGFSCSLLNRSMYRLVFASEKVEHNRELVITTQEEAIIQLERYIKHYFPDIPPWKVKNINLTNGTYYTLHPYTTRAPHYTSLRLHILYCTPHPATLRYTLSTHVYTQHTHAHTQIFSYKYSLQRYWPARLTSAR